MSDDDTDDVQWEDAEETEISNIADQNISIELEDNSVNRDDNLKKSLKVAKKKLKLVKFTENCYDVALTRHQEGCKKQLRDALATALFCEDESIACFMHSLLPAPLTNIQGDSLVSLSWLQKAGTWFTREFKVLPDSSMTTEEGRDGSPPDELEDCVIGNRAGSAHQLTQLFYALMKALGVTVRYVCTVDPQESYLPAEHEDLYLNQWTQAAKKENADKTDSAGSSSGAGKYKNRKVRSEVVPSCWLEVYIPMPRSVETTQFADLTEEDARIGVSGGAGEEGCVRSGADQSTTVNSFRWVHVDVVRGLYDQPQAVESQVRRGRQVQYVVGVVYSEACSPDQSLSNSLSPLTRDCRRERRVVDLTARYRHLHRHSTAKEKEIGAFQSAWLASYLLTLGRHKSSSAASALGEGSRNSTLLNATKATSVSVTQGGSGMEVVDLCSDDDQAPAHCANNISGSSSSSSSWNANDSATAVTSRINGDNGGSVNTNSSLVSSGSVRKRKLPSAQDDELPLPAVSAAHSLLASPMPTRLADFKDHPVYLLERHLLCEEMLHPVDRKVVGVVRGESVYLQQHREKLFTRTKWRRQLKAVRQGEEPVKVLTRKNVVERQASGDSHRSFNYRSGTIEQSSSSNNSSSGGETREIKLFGSWQTEPFEVPAVVDGVIPMNEFGNAEVWEGLPVFVSRGAALVTHPSALKAAKNLGLHHVPAVVGFDFKGQFNVPRVGGVLVLREHEQLLLDAALCVEAQQEENYYLKREKAIYGRWKRLVACVLSRQGLLEKYGH